MRRKIYGKLLEWKAEDGAVALMIDGARRVGKSYIAKELGRNEYRSFILIDFNAVDSQIKELFEKQMTDLDTFFTMLQAFFGVKLYPRESLIILDEVQEFPRARACIKYLVEDGRYDYIETGSLVSINKNVKDIMIPSEEEHLEMFPMDFEEFLWAVGDDPLMDMIRMQFNASKPMGAALHRQAMIRFRQYMLVGGMPQAVAQWVEKNDFDAVDRAKRRILALYRADIAKHTSIQKERVESIFDTIPSQLSKHDKKFKLSSLGKNARMREYEDAFVWLDDAMLVNLCFNSTDPNVGLRLNEDRASMKCYMGDTGLLISMVFDDHGHTDNEIYKKLLFDKLEVNQGMLVENITAQMLVAAGHRLFFFTSPSDKAEDRMEIDFLITKRGVTSRHNISPIEVKSSARYALSSLNKFLTKFGNRLSTPYVLHSKDLEIKEGITYLPLYMAPLL